MFSESEFSLLRVANRGRWALLIVAYGPTPVGEVLVPAAVSMVPELDSVEEIVLLVAELVPGVADCPQVLE